MIRGSWTPERDAILGRWPDAVVAAAFGAQTATVRLRRHALGIPLFKGKTEIVCATCGRPIQRKRARKDAICKTCRAAYVHQHYLDHRPERKLWSAAHYRANKAHVDARVSAWKKLHRAAVNRTERRYQRKKRKDAERELAFAPCLECGMKHTPERRAAIILRLLPRTAGEIREAWPCIWGSPGADAAGSARLTRDLHKIGARMDRDLTWYAPARAVSGG